MRTDSTARYISQNDVTNDQLLLSNQTDWRVRPLLTTVRRKSIWDYAAKIFFSIPVLSYAVTEILICCMWNLILSLVYRLCSLAFDIIYRITRQVPVQDHYYHQTVAIRKARTFKETSLSSGVKQASEADFNRSAESPETFGSYKKTIKAKEPRPQTTAESVDQQNVNTIKNMKERSPQLITRQWVRQKVIWKMDRDIKEYDVSLHKNSAAICQTDTGGTGGQYEKKDNSTLGSQNHGMEESVLHQRQEKAFECNLRVGTENTESKEEESCSSKVSPLSYFNVISCKSTAENANGLKEANTSILVSDRSTVSKEQCYSGVTGTPEKHSPVSTPLEDGGAQISKLPSLEHVATVCVAPACVATTPNYVNAARAVEEETSQHELPNSRLEDLFTDKHNKDAEVTRSGPYPSRDTLEVRNAKMEQTGKSNAPNYPEIQNESQKRAKAKNFWSKYRVNSGKCSKFRFMSMRLVQRNNNVPRM